MARIIQGRKIKEDFSLKKTNKQKQKEFLEELSRFAPVTIEYPKWREIKFDVEKFLKRLMSFRDKVIAKTLDPFRGKLKKEAISLSETSHIVMSIFAPIRSRLEELWRDAFHKTKSKSKKKVSTIRRFLSDICNLFNRIFPNTDNEVAF